MKLQTLIIAVLVCFLLYTVPVLAPGVGTATSGGQEKPVTGEQDTVTGEKLEQLRQQYETAKENYLTAKSAYEAAKAKWTAVKPTFATANTDAVEKARNFLNSSTKYIRDNIDVIKRKVDSSPYMSDGRKTELKAELDGYIATLQADHELVVTSQGRDGIRNASKQAVADWERIRPQLKRIAGELLAARAQNAIDKAGEISANLDAKLANLTAAGKNVTKLAGLGEKLKADIATAQTDLDSASAALAEVRTATDTKAALKHADELLRKAFKALVQLHRDAKDILHEIRRVGASNEQQEPEDVEVNESAPTAVEDD